MPNILFRADAEKSIGIGDLKSLIYLSGEFRKNGWGAYFLVKDYEPALKIAGECKDKNIFMVSRDTGIDDECEIIKRFCPEHAIDCLFMEITKVRLTDYERLGRPAPIMACANFDGIVGEGFDLIVNWCVDSGDETYKYSKAGTILCGFENTILPDRLNWERIAVRSYGAAKRILISMGGVDEFDLTGRVLKALAPAAGNFDIRVIVGPGHAARNKAGFPGVVFKEGSFDLFEDYLWADVAFSAGGLTSSELVATRTPAVLIAAYPHQVARCEYYANKGWAFYIGGERDADEDAIRRGFKGLLGAISTCRHKLVNSKFRGGNEKIFKIIDSCRQSK